MLQVSHTAGVLKPGDVLCIKNEGMPREKRPRERGDLYVVLDIKFPDSKWKPSPALKDILPVTTWPKLEGHADAQTDVTTGSPISKAEYEARMHKQSRDSQNHAEYGYQDSGSGCQQQ
ncbi:DnaJ-like protein xdj1 [Coemansia sp. RSA 678]|nr:DnaJ-like protein xdj1 [Coemansia sp. RSA 678]